MNDTEKQADTQLSTETVTRGENSLTLDAMNPADLVRQVQLIQEVMKTVMIKDTHYGVIPGTGNKPSLLKPGAEKLGFVFRLAPKFEISERTSPDGHREYQVTCNLEQIHTGRSFGSGVGSCSTMEGKYRYRAEVIEGPKGPAIVPQGYWDSRDPKWIGGPQYSVKKQDGQWVIAHKVEHPNPADYYNTVLKMAKKRAHVDAILTATAASDIFTQDVEDMPEVIRNPSVHQGVEKNVTPIAERPPTPAEPSLITYQGIIEKAFTTKAKKDDKEQRDWYNAMSNGRELWTRKPDIGQELLDSLGAEVILTLVQSKRFPNKYQVMSLRIPDRPAPPNMADEPPDDIPGLEAQ